MATETVAEQMYAHKKMKNVPYVHLTKKSYLADRRGTLPTASFIYKNYAQQADKLENEALESFSNNKEKFKQIIDLYKQISQEKESEEAFVKIGEYMSNTFIDKSVGGARIAGIKGVEAMKKALDNSADFLNAINKIVEEFNEVDSLFLNYLETKGLSNNIDINKSGLAILSNSGVAEAMHHANNILEVQKALSKGASNASILNITHSIGTDINKAKGGMEEVLSAMCDKAIAEQIFKDQGFLTSMEMKVTGEDKVYMNEADRRWQYISDVSKNTSSAGGFRAKSDHVASFFETNSDGTAVKIGMVGTTVKSHKEGGVGNTNIMSASPWSNVLTFSDLTNTYFEYNFVNKLVHEQDDVTGSKGIMNRYLASKAATYMISGASGLGSTPALFMTYSNKAMYLPDLLKDISKKKSPEFRVSLSTKPKIVNERKKQKGLSDEELSYIRSKDILALVRKGAKFIGTK